MSVIRSPTQIHDGYATIRTRGQCRATSKYIIDRSERCRTLSFASKTKSVNLLNNRKSYGSDNSSSNASTTNSSGGSSGANQVCTTFRPLSVESGKTSQFSLESLQSSTATPKTPDYINTIDDDGVFLYSEPESPNYVNYSHYFSNIYATPKKSLKTTTTSVAAATSAANNHYKSPKNNSPIYSSVGLINHHQQQQQQHPSTTTYCNYRRPNMVINNRKSSSVEILDDYSHIATDILESLHNSSAEDIVVELEDVDVDDEDIFLSSNVPLLCEKKFYTLGHTRRRGNNSRGTYYSNHNRRYYQKSVSVTAPIEKKSYGRSCGSIATSVNSSDAEYMDPLDFKIGCQTTLRSKPIIPWYELAIKKDFRQSCPPITTSKSSDAQVVTAFEQSLGNMTQRLQHLTATAERKDGELTDMRQTIELLKKQSIQAGLTSAHMQSMGVQSPQQNNNNNQIKTPSHIVKSQPILNGSSNIATIQTVPSTITTATTLQRHHSTDSMCSINSIGSNCSTQDKNKKKKGWLRSSFTKAFSRNAKIAKTSRHHLNHNHHHSFAGNGDSSSKCETPPLQSTPIKSHLDSKLPKLPQPLGSGSPSKLGGIPQKTVTVIDNAKPIDAIDEANPVVEDLKRQLREKDLVLTDTRLEALNSASQLENMKEQMNKMRAQMKCLKEDNLRLHKFYSSRSLAGSEVSLGNPVSPNGSIGDNRRYSLADGNSRPPMELPTSLEEDVEEENIPPAPAPEPPPQSMSPTTHIDLTPPPPALETIQLPSIRSPNVQHHTTAVEDIPDITDGKKISISVYLGQPEAFQKYYEEVLESDRIYGDDDIKSYSNEANNEFIIAFTYISGKTTWQNLDYIVRKTFKDYLAKIDPGTNLGLNTDSITSYHLGDAKRGPEVGFPELLPCGYIIGNVRSLYICLQGVGSLAFDSLIPRSIVHRYISLLGEHRRLILCGPSGTGKSYLARRLAEFLVAKSGRENISEAIATFNVDHKSSKDLQEYLGHIAEQSSMANGASDLPSVIILDNLHHASALGDVFSCLLSAGPASKLPCIIGTMSQATCNTTNLQLHHNFRWVLTANHMEPVKGFLSRFLRRRLFTIDLTALHAQPELQKVLAWLPTVWQHINRFLENHSSSDVTIGPRLFLSCPMDLKDSQVWFTDIWNYHLAPYIIEAVREGVQLYGRRGGAWNDPSTFIRDTYPWPYGPDSVPPLRQINAEEVGLEGSVNQNSDQPDPLMNMLMRLQEAANYSENQEQESDCASLDSNITPDSSAGAE